MKGCVKFPSVKAFLWLLALSFFASVSPAQTISPFNTPLYFEANKDQTAFLSVGNDYQFLVSASGAQITLHDSLAAPATAQMRFAGANPGAKVQGEGELPGKINFFIGNDSSQWQTGLPTFARVQITEIYPGINLVFHGNQQQLEYDFALAPDADPNAIRIHFDGVDKISLTPQGDLILKIGRGEVRQPKPEIYQTVADARQIIGGGYKILDSQTVAFEIGDYNHSLPLVIDPVLVYSAYFASSKATTGWAIARDTNDCTYIAGQTVAKGFFTPNAVQTNFAGGKFTGDAFVAKFDNTGTNLIYLTYLGGTNDEAAYALAVDGNSDVFITGYTDSTNFPVVNPLPDHAQISGKRDPNAGRFPADAFVTELSPDGSSLVYSTYLGGNSTDIGYGIALDSLGDAYVTGLTYSTNFPVTATALLDHLACTNDFYNSANAFVAEVAPGGGALVYSTYLGGTNYDAGRAIAVDGSDNVLVAGFTSSTNFPTWHIPAGLPIYLNGVTNKKGNNDNSFDAFVTKFPPLTSLIPVSSQTNFYSTYLGGTNSETAYGIAVDAAGHAYVTGFTASTNFPTTNNNPPGLFSFMVTNGTANRVATNVFLTELDTTNGAVLHSVVFGGRGVDIGYGVAVDAAGDAFVVGGSTSTNFPTMNTSGPLSATNSYKQGYDVFVTGFSNDWSRMYYSVFVGGRKDDIGHGIALDEATNVFITGKTMSTNFPTTNAGVYFFNGGTNTSGTNFIDGTEYVGTNDAFITEIALGELPSGPVITSPLPSAQTNGLLTTFNLTITASGTPPLVYQWQITTNSAIGITNFPAGSLTNLNAKDKKRFAGTTSNSLTIIDAQLTNTATYVVVVTNNWGAVTDSVDLTILPFAPDITVALTNQTVGEGDTVIFPTTVTGTLPLHFQWQFNGTNLANKSPFSGANSNTLVLVNVQTTNAGTYSLIVTNNYGSVTDSMTLTVLTFPPEITNAPPQFQTNGLKTAFALTVGVSGSPPLIYQWQFNGTNLTSKDKGYIGINSNSLVFPDAQTNQSGDYTVIVTNRYGSATTNANVLIIPMPPVITVPPTNQTVNVGDRVVFQVNGTGTEPVHVQWLLNGTNLLNKSPFSGVNTAALVITNVQLSQAGTYSVIVTNAYGSASTNATLTVLSFPPVITNAPPLFQTNASGTTFSLTINASGSPRLFYQWQLNGTNLTTKSKNYVGVNSNSLTIKDALTNQSGDYTVIVTNSFGQASTNMNVLIIPLGPEIPVPPTNQTVGIGNTVTFPITATGSPTLHYQWQRDGTNLLNKGNFRGVNTNTLKITAATTNDSGTISIIVTNNYGAVTDSVTFTVLALPPQIDIPPTNQLSGVGPIASASFTLTASGSLPLFYQWQTNGVNLTNGDHYIGVNSNTLVINDVQTNDGVDYEVVVSNAYGTVITNASLTIVTTPVIISFGPTNQTVAPGSTVSFTLVATGTPGVPLLYAWSTDGGDELLTNNDRISGATNGTGTLTISNVQASDAGTYTAFAYYTIALANSQNLFASTNAILTVTSALNIGSIVLTSSGDGLVISGSGGTTNGSYSVLISSNLLAPLNSWTPIQTNQFDNEGNFIFTNTGQTNDQEFYILKQP